jgi:hypothetical protein
LHFFKPTKTAKKSQPKEKNKTNFQVKSPPPTFDHEQPDKSQWHRIEEGPYVFWLPLSPTTTTPAAHHSTSKAEWAEFLRKKLRKKTPWKGRDVWPPVFDGILPAASGPARTGKTERSAGRETARGSRGPVARGIRSIKFQPTGIDAWDANEITEWLVKRDVWAHESPSLASPFSLRLVKGSLVEGSSAGGWLKIDSGWYLPVQPQDEPVLVQISDTPVVRRLAVAIDAVATHMDQDFAVFHKYLEQLSESLERAAKNEGLPADATAALRKALEELAEKRTGDREAALDLAIQVCELAGPMG